MKVGVPNIASAEAYTSNLQNQLNMDITLTMYHPCRESVLTNQVVPAMSAIVGHGPNTYIISPFVHSRTAHPGSGGDCGLLSFTI
jgi:hypothetical protein